MSSESLFPLSHDDIARAGALRQSGHLDEAFSITSVVRDFSMENFVFLPLNKKKDLLEASRETVVNRTSKATRSWDASSAALYLKEVRNDIVSIYHHPDVQADIKSFVTNSEGSPYEFDIETKRDEINYLLALAGLTGNTALLTQAIEGLDQIVNASYEASARTVAQFTRDRLVNKKDRTQASFSAMKASYQSATKASEAINRQERVATVASRYSVDALFYGHPIEALKGFGTFVKAAWKDHSTLNIFRDQLAKVVVEPIQHWNWRRTTPLGEDYKYLELNQQSMAETKPILENEEPIIQQAEPFYSDLVTSIGKASERIVIQCLHFEPPTQEIQTELCAATRRGVSVRLVLDNPLTMDDEKWVDVMRDAGVIIEFINPSRKLPRLPLREVINQFRRQDPKVVVIDDVAWVGSANINKYEMNDNTFKTSFNPTIRFGKNRKRADEIVQLIHPKKGVVSERLVLDQNYELLFNDETDFHTLNHRELMKFARKAKKELIMFTPFMPVGDDLTVLFDAAKRGVPVILLLSSPEAPEYNGTMSRPLYLTSLAQVKLAQMRGIPIAVKHTSPGSMMHGKGIVEVGRKLMLGSYNGQLGDALDASSLTVLTSDPLLVKQCEEMLSQHL